MSDLVISISFALYSAVVYGIMAYCLGNGVRIAEALQYEQDMKRHWQAYAASADTASWPFYDGMGVY